jgi:hypothetical protein
MFFIIAEYIKIFGFTFYKTEETSSYNVTIQADYPNQEELDALV